LRSQLERYIAAELGFQRLNKSKSQTELRKIKKEIASLRKRLAELEGRRDELEKEMKK
jgi:cell division protein FtsB